MIRRLDDWVVAQTQRAYLWLYDWTGVYVGACMFTLAALSWVVDNRTGSLAAAMFGVLIIAPLCAHRVYLQSTDEDAFNLAAERDLSNFLRVPITMTIAAFVLYDVVVFNLRGVLGDTLWLALFYLLTVKLRRREPKEFFEREGATNEH